MTTVIRPARLEDARAIAAVHLASWRHELGGSAPPGVLAGLDLSAQQDRVGKWLLDPQASTLVGEQDGRVEGFITVGHSRDGDADARTGCVVAIYLLPEALGRGLGRRLCQAGLDVLREAGIEQVTLWCLQANARGRGFYEHMGFAPDGATRVEARLNLPSLRYRMSLVRPGA